MDGTGELFDDFLSNFSGHYIVIPLPEYGLQDHASLAEIIKGELPTDDYILLAESFSGGIVPILLKQNLPHLKGVIFVASFLSAPHQYLLSIAKRLPIKTLVSMPLSTFAHKLLFFGQGASKTLLSQFVKVVKSIPEQLLKNRLQVMSKQQRPTETFDIPVVYIQARSDRLISPEKGQEFSMAFNNIKYIAVDGPHFLLQAQPKALALLVTKLMPLGNI